MTARARIAALIGVFGLLLAVLTVGTAPAGAAPYTPAATVSVSESNPCHGDSVVVTGSGYEPGSTVTVLIGDTPVGRATVGADGTFRVTITIPDAPDGRQTLSATGSVGGQIATTTLDIGNCGLGTAPDGASQAASAAAANGGAGVMGEGDSRGTNGGGSGGLSNTGVAVLGLLVIAVALVGVGGALLVGGRRRRSGAARAA